MSDIKFLNACLRFKNSQLCKMQSEFFNGDLVSDITTAAGL